MNVHYDCLLQIILLLTVQIKTAVTIPKKWILAALLRIIWSPQICYAFSTFNQLVYIKDIYIKEINLTAQNFSTNLLYTNTHAMVYIKKTITSFYSSVVKAKKISFSVSVVLSVSPVFCSSFQTNSDNAEK